MKTKTILMAAFACLFMSVNANWASDSLKTVKVPSGKMSAEGLAELTKNLEYDFAKQAVRDSYYKKLDQLAQAVIDDDYAVSLKGHADAIGPYKYNWVLSDKRALSVKSYLISKGVKENRIVSTPFGSTVPIATNKTASGRQKNRRVEIDLRKISE